MAASGSQSLARSRGLPATGQRGGQPDRLAAGWVALIPAVITLGVTLYRIDGPSFTRDEGATLLAVHRGLGQLIRMLGNVDVVHAEYYALIWVVARLAGPGELAVRAPSALAMAVAAGGVTLLGQRLVSGRAGLAAGLLFAALPPVSYYAQDAREYAIAAALATVSGYLLVRALQAGTKPRHAGTGQVGVGLPRAGVRTHQAGIGPHQADAAPPQAGFRPQAAGTGRPRHRARYGWLAGYAAVLALLGLANILSLLIIVAHAVTVAVWQRHHGSPGGPFVLRWLAGVGVVLLVASPVAVIASGQLHQVQWIKTPKLSDLVRLEGLIGPHPVFLIVAVVVGLALAVGLTEGLSRLRYDWPAGLYGLAVPWLLVPPALLLGISVAHVVHPLYAFRYVAFCIPAAALLGGTALAALARPALGWPVAVAALAVIVLAALPAQSHERGPAGHGYGIRMADRAVARLSRSGDALMNIRYWPMKWGGGVERGLEGEYPFGLGRLHDISEAAAPVPSATLGGTFARTSLERRRLASVTRLWVASWSPATAALPRRLGFSLATTVHTKGVWVRLYTRHRPAPAARTAVPASGG